MVNRKDVGGVNYMNYRKKTVLDIDLRRKKVFVRCDFNVPMTEDGRIANDARIIQTLPTLKYLLECEAAIILCSHMGRPKNGYEEKLSLKPVARRVSQILDTEVKFPGGVVDEKAQKMAAELQPGEVMLLENVRFEKGETKNDPELAKKYAAMADIYINDAFGTSHRAHASTVGVAKLLPAVSGLLVYQELRIMGRVLDAPQHPFVLVVGGSKVSDKITVLENLLPKLDAIIIGGAMSYTFTKALGGKVGNSLVDDEYIGYCLDFLKKAREMRVRVLLPTDVLAAERFERDAEPQIFNDGELPENMIGMDIGPETIADYTQAVRGAATIIWNGPMGVFEFPAFAEGTRAVAKAVAESRATSVVGGGDSITAVLNMGLVNHVGHISTGGGASLEFISGKELPGIACLMDAEPPEYAPAAGRGKLL